MLLEKPGKNPVHDLQDTLDRTVTAAFGFDPGGDLLEQLLDLNFDVAARSRIQLTSMISPNSDDLYIQ